MPYKDPGKRRENKRRWRANPDNKAKERAYPIDPKKRQASNSAWNRRHPDTCRTASNKWAQANPEKKKKLYAEWRRRPGAESARKQRRRGLKVRARGHCSSAELLARVEMFGGLCYVRGCGKPHEAIDHVIPLSKGGTNWPANLRPICKSHNSQKRNQDWRKWVCP